MLYDISRLFTAAFTLTACPYTRTHAFWLLLSQPPAAPAGFCLLALPLPHSRLNAVQRYDTKTILTNFCVKISQWNAFLVRRRCAIQAECGAIRVIIVIVSDTGYCRRLRSLQGEAYDNRSYPVHWFIFACLHAGGPPRRNSHDWRRAANALLACTDFPHAIRTFCTWFNKL